jgi:hypothetical protein
MGLGRRRSGRDDEQVSLLDVSARHLPFYLVFVEVAVVVVILMSVGETDWECQCLSALGSFVDKLAEYLNSYVSGAILICGAIEGVLVGITKRLINQTRRQARKEGREEGIEEGREEGIETGRIAERERLFGSGVPVLCPVWGTPAMMFPPSRSAAVYGIDSPQAGGKYEISLQLMAELVNRSIVLTDAQKEAVTAWLADQKTAGRDIPVLTSEVVRNHIWRDRPSENGDSND